MHDLLLAIPRPQVRKAVELVDVSSPLHKRAVRLFSLDNPLRLMRMMVVLVLLLLVLCVSLRVHRRDCVLVLVLKLMVDSSSFLLMLLHQYVSDRGR